MNEQHRAEKLKDRRNYRQALIQRKEDIERKIQNTEGQINRLKEA